MSFLGVERGKLKKHVFLLTHHAHADQYKLQEKFPKLEIYLSKQRFRLPSNFLQKTRVSTMFYLMLLISTCIYLQVTYDQLKNTYV